MPIISVAETPEFQRRARAMMSDDERMALIDYVARNPTAGVSIGGGVRKFRYAREGAGKSGSYRVIHFYAQDDSVPIFLITIFAKSEKANLTQAETEAVKTLGKLLANHYRSLKEAIAHTRGQTATEVHEIEIPDADVQAIRTRTGLSQAEFAKSIGVKKATLLNWEQHRRSPEGPARVLLALIDKDPKIVQRTLTS
jgi:DNA-binding transcriptional regulator YiaG